MAKVEKLIVNCTTIFIALYNSEYSVKYFSKVQDGKKRYEDSANAGGWSGVLEKIGGIRLLHSGCLMAFLWSRSIYLINNVGMPPSLSGIVGINEFKLNKEV